MTREEAIEILLDMANELQLIPESKQGQAFKMAIEALEQLTSYEQTINKLTEAISEQEPFDIETYCKEHFCVMVDKDVWEKAEKALKQENVLNEMFENIKTEIDFIPTYGAKFADGSINVHVNKKDVLQIIDKYRGE